MNIPTSTTHDIRVTQLTITPHNKPTFDDMAFSVSIVDDGAVEFLSVHSMADKAGVSSINKEEWPALRDAIEYMVSQCKDFTK